jgi:hypothetical protein
LQVLVRPYPGVQGVDPWFDTEIRVEAHPFGGVLETVFTLADFRRWAEDLQALGARADRKAPRRHRQTALAVLGGDRAAELVIECETQEGGLAGAQSLDVRITPSGDDPFPWLRYLIFDVEPSVWDDAQAAIARLG